MTAERLWHCRNVTSPPPLLPREAGEEGGHPTMPHALRAIFQPDSRIKTYLVVY